MLTPLPCLHPREEQSWGDFLACPGPAQGSPLSKQESWVEKQPWRGARQVGQQLRGPRSAGPASHPETFLWTHFTDEPATEARGLRGVH